MSHCNETCGLTNLPIQNGDNIVAIIIAQTNKPFKPTQYSATDTATPLLLPIRGIYNDYNGITQPVIDELTSYILQNIHLKNEYDEPLQGSNKNLIKTIVRGKAFCKMPFTIDNSHKTIVNIQFYHADIYDQIVHSVGERIPCNIKHNTSQNTLFECWKKGLLDYINRKKKEEESSIYGAFIKDMPNILSPMGYVYIDRILQPNQSFNIDKFTTLAAQYICFIEALTLLRKGFGSCSGKGSQSFELELHRQIAEYILQFYEHQKQVYEKEQYLTNPKPRNIFEESVWFDI